MSDLQSMTEIIQQQIRTAVDQQVATVISDSTWREAMEQQIIEHVRARITAKFANISTVPDLVKTVENSVERLIKQGQVPGIDQYVDQNTIRLAIDSAVQDLIQRTIDSLVLDNSWIQKIESLVNQAMVRKLSSKIGDIAMDAVIVEHIDSSIDKWQQRFLENFKSIGITDQATNTQMTIMDDGIVIATGLAAAEMLVENDATINGTLLVKDLAVKGSINVDNHSWSALANNVSDMTLSKMTDHWRQELVREILDLARTQNIDFESITLQGNPLVTGNTLSSVITETEIQQTGTLRTLKVSGDTDLGDTVAVRKNRVGVNTDSPEMALSIWDEEVSLIMGKSGKQQAYLGTSRLQNLAIGINRVSLIDLDVDGLTTIKKLRVGQHRVAFERQVPGYSGTRGDIVFNSDPKDGQPFAWQCLGGFQWRPLKAE
jgi:hypothetical protein